MRNRSGELEFPREHHTLFPAQYPAIVDILNNGVEALCDRGAAVAPRIRVSPYDRPRPDPTLLIASDLW